MILFYVHIYRWLDSAKKINTAKLWYIISPLKQTSIYFYNPNIIYDTQKK